MIKLTLLIKDKQNGTPGEVCEEIQKLIESVESEALHNSFRYEIEEAKAERVERGTKP